MVKFISLLGTGKYTTCNYYLDNEELRAENCCYIQQGALDILREK